MRIMEIGNEIDLDFVLSNFTKVTYYPDPITVIQGIFFQCNRTAKDAQVLERELADRAGIIVGNPMVYGIENDYGVKIYVMCSDFRMYFGSELLEKGS